MKQIDMEKKKLGILDGISCDKVKEGNRHVEFMMDYIKEHYLPGFPHRCKRTVRHVLHLSGLQV